MATSNEPVRGAIIFSLVDGFVWACWPGTSASVRLGDHEPVIEMMRDFLAQCDLGARLTGERKRDG
jgi:hypothetical protein